MAQDDANVDQDGTKIVQVEAKMAILRPFGELFYPFLVVLGAIFRKTAEV